MVNQQILALIPDNDSLQEMLEVCFEDQVPKLSEENFRRLGILSAAMSFYIAQAQFGHQVMTIKDFAAVGLEYLTKTEFTFSRWLLVISGCASLQSKFNVIFGARIN